MMMRTLVNSNFSSERNKAQIHLVWGPTQPDVVNIGRGKTLLIESEGQVMDI